MYIRQREPAKIVSKEWKLTIVFLRGLNVVSPDGNGRVGRMILNQQLINNGLLPVTFSAKGKYRQAFRIYDRNKDTSSIVHIIGKAQEEAISRITQLDISLKKSLDINKGEQFEW